MNRQQLNLLNRLVLAQVYIFSKQCEVDKSSMPDIAFRMKTAGFNSFHINKFTDEERAHIKKIANLPPMEDLKKTQTSSVINILELMRIWAEDIPKEDRPNINISDKLLLRGKNHYIMHMIALKRNTPETYVEMDDLIVVSTENIEKWYNMAKDYIKENV